MLRLPSLDGDGGVFVISSFFLICKQGGNDEVGIINQTKHRSTRLYPPYVTVLLGAALCALPLGKLPYAIVIHLLFMHNFQWMVTGYSSSM